MDDMFQVLQSIINTFVIFNVAFDLLKKMIKNLRKPGQPPKIVSQIEISQSNRHFKRIHVSHEIVGCNMSNAPSTTPLRAR